MENVEKEIHYSLENNKEQKEEHKMKDLCKFGIFLSLIIATIISFYVIWYITIPAIYTTHFIFLYILGLMLQLVSILLCVKLLGDKVQKSHIFVGIWLLLFTGIIGGVAILCSNCQE